MTKELHMRAAAIRAAKKTSQVGRVVVVLLAVGSAIVALGLYGAYNIKEYRWPRNDLVNIYRTFFPRESGNNSYYGRFGRLDRYPNKVKIRCPLQKDSTAVILAIGQSNVANEAERKVPSEYPESIVNYYNGTCYAAGSPLLGSTGDAGEVLTLLGNRLIEQNLFEQVVLVPAAIGGSPISRWQSGGDLNAMMLGVIDQVQTKYKITHVIWHQGESDLARRTSTPDYVRMFQSTVTSMRAHNVDARILVSITTKCKDDVGWAPNNLVAVAQRAVVDPTKGIYLGADTDVLLTDADRYDGCHLAHSGQMKLAGSLFEAIARAN